MKGQDVEIYVLSFIANFVTSDVLSLSKIFFVSTERFRDLCKLNWLMLVRGTSQLYLSQNIFPKMLVTFKIKNLATCNYVKNWGKVAPWQG